MSSYFRAALLMAAIMSVPASAQVPRCPNIVITYDASGSMLAGTPDKSGAASQRYLVGREAVSDLLSSGTPFRYGLHLFGRIAGTTNCTTSSATCSYNPSTDATCRAVQADYNTGDKIRDVLNFVPDQNATTPTALALDTVATRADILDTLRGRYVLLITDGEPNCDRPPPEETPIQETVKAIAQLSNAGVKTFVLGFGSVSSTLQNNLNQMAVAGGTSRVTSCDIANDTCFYDAADGAALQDALNAIVAVVGGEFGGGGCDDSCYAQGCPNPGDVCVNNTCQADPCSQVSCNAGSVCVDGQCTSVCDPGCRGSKPICVNGNCQASVECSPSCDGRNQVCVQGSCVEDYCSSGTLECPEGFNCVKNACTRALSGTLPDGGSLLPDGGIPVDPSGGGGSTPSDGGGCCSGAPGAFSVLGILFALSTLSLMRRRTEN